MLNKKLWFRVDNHGSVIQVLNRLSCFSLWRCFMLPEPFPLFLTLQCCSDLSTLTDALLTFSNCYLMWLLKSADFSSLMFGSVKGQSEMSNKFVQLSLNICTNAGLKKTTGHKTTVMASNFLKLAENVSQRCTGCHRPWSKMNIHLEWCISRWGWCRLMQILFCVLWCAIICF